MKTIKIIDLLNKIANGEEVPKRIKYKNVFLKYRNDIKDYGGDRYFLTELISIENIGLILNDEVEIIEEKKIPEKLKDILRIDDLIPPVDENMYRIWKQVIKNYNKLNEICDYLESKEKGE